MTCRPHIDSSTASVSYTVFHALPSHSEWLGFEAAAVPHSLGSAFFGIIVLAPREAAASLFARQRQGSDEMFLKVVQGSFQSPSSLLWLDLCLIESAATVEPTKE